MLGISFHPTTPPPPKPNDRQQKAGVRDKDKTVVQQKWGIVKIARE